MLDIRQLKLVNISWFLFPNVCQKLGASKIVRKVFRVLIKIYFEIKLPPIEKSTDENNISQILGI